MSGNDRASRDEELRSLLLDTFAEEAREHLEALGSGLLDLERAEGPRSKSLLDDLFREAHSLKGAAMAVELAAVGELAHALETLLGEVRDGDLVPDAEAFDTAHRTLDAIRDLIEAEPVAAPSIGVPTTPSSGNGGERPQAAAPGTAGEATVRVATGKLDALMTSVGRLVAARLQAESRAAEAASLVERAESALDTGELTALRDRLKADSRRMGQLATELQLDVRSTRMRPVAVILAPLRRLPRDLARELGKEVDLTLEGEDVEADAAVLEALKAPLTHLLRNAVDHGIEAPAARHDAGKPARGTVAVRARHAEGRLVLTVEDDGGGVDVAALRRAAAARGVADSDIDEHAALDLMFASGLSTRPVVTGLSGRGVGLDAVREAVDRLHGVVEIDSQPGEGASFTLRVPLSVASTPCLLVDAGAQRFALPLIGVQRVISLHADELGSSEGVPVVTLDGRPVPVGSLPELLGLRGEERGGEDGPTAPRPAVVLQTGRERAALLVDGLGAAVELATRPLPTPLPRVPFVSSVTVLGDGTVAPVLSVAELMRACARRERPTGVATPSARPVPAAPRILVVDDSLTIRTLNRNILEAAGYRVEIAADGAQAWDALRTEPFDLVVADVDMPAMDGRELTVAIRDHEPLRRLPVILLTAHDSAEDRERGMAAGADAYLTKGVFDQAELLGAIERLL